MPHIVIEASEDLAGSIPWNAVISKLHAELSANGWCALGDLKTRVHGCRYAQCGGDHATGQLVATLLMTNPRSDEVQQAMANTILDQLAVAVGAVGLGPAQICVIHKYVPRTRYRRLDIAARLPVDV